MGKFNKTGKREMPALNTSSLPDLMFQVGKLICSSVFVQNRLLIVSML